MSIISVGGKGTRLRGWFLAVGVSLFTATFALAAVPAAEAQVGTWLVSGRPKAVACFHGQCASERGERSESILIIESNGTYRSPSFGAACARRALPDEIGLWRLEGNRPRRQKVVLEATNVAEVQGVVESCFGSFPLTITLYANRFKLTNRERKIKGTATLRGFVIANNRKVKVKSIYRYRGRPTLDLEVPADTSFFPPSVMMEEVDAVVRDVAVGSDAVD